MGFDALILTDQALEAFFALLCQCHSALVDPQQLQECFLSWVQQLTEQLEINLIHLDGKTARGSYDRERSLRALQTVSAWASEHHLVLAQHRVESTSNEITAIPELLNLLDLDGAIITLDAMGTQRESAAQIREQGGDYILALKGNQGTLHHAVKTFFQEAERTQWATLDYSYSSTTEAGHHRIEHRQVWAVPLSQVPELPTHQTWSGLATVVMVSATANCGTRRPMRCASTSAVCQLRPVCWPKRSAPIGASKIACTGCWMSPFGKTRVGFAAVMVLKTWASYGVWP
ncbi:ISAs1 family transposase [Halomicronema hongdechloris C2206]|uniref:ISAs1 family transposase n=1 Tax=Halomicronema hongdechloris C2206 TaxID=1641165 RepID=A0A1Z3HJK6_9CYAN|nr:ISAs1 family transposase [Halomicronema hongdechloris]ASC70465.1 ISAs1 family transposase [Halomicronema hongdechloris C2206]